MYSYRPEQLSPHKAAYAHTHLLLNHMLIEVTSLPLSMEGSGTSGSRAERPAVQDKGLLFSLDKRPSYFALMKGLLLLLYKKKTAGRCAWYMHNVALRLSRALCAEKRHCMYAGTCRIYGTNSSKGEAPLSLAALDVEELPVLLLLLPLQAKA